MLFNPCTLEDGVDKSDYEYLKPFDPYDYAFFRFPGQGAVKEDSSPQGLSPQIPARDLSGKSSTLNKPRIPTPQRKQRKEREVRPQPRTVPPEEPPVEEADPDEKANDNDDFY